MKITEDIKYIGVYDNKIDLFESQYTVPDGILYNSYAIIDEKIAIIDSVEKNFKDEWLLNIKNTLSGRTPDFLIVQHMEPDHSANIASFMNEYPNAKIVASSKAFNMMKNFFGTDFGGNQIVVSDGDEISLGKHKLSFYTAPMVHWPEVIVTYDSFDKVLFSADAFGTFGNNVLLEDWEEEARRYYINIVGKYGVQVKALLEKAKKLDINIICALHGPLLLDNLTKYVSLYEIWANYDIEEDGVLIAYTSVYGNTKSAALKLEELLKEKGIKKIKTYDLARCDLSFPISDAFKFGKIVFATTTYNNNIFPFMREFIEGLVEHNFQNRTVAFIENGSWAPNANKIMKNMLDGCKNLKYAETDVKILSALNEESEKMLNLLADELII